MRLAILDRHEAADSAVMANVARYLLGGEPITIAHADRPDMGREVAPTVIPATQGTLLGAPTAVIPPVAAPLALDPVAAFAPSSAAAEAAPTAPVATIPPTPPAVSAPALPPAPVVAAPSAPVAQPSPAASVDKNGLPWDERIHTSTKTTNKDGTWRQKRETDPALVAQVEAELRARVGLPAAAPVAPPAPATPPAPPSAASVFATGVAAAVEAGAPAAPNTFGELMLWVTPKMTAGKLDNAGLQGVLTAHGVASLPALIAAPDKVPAIYQHLAAMLGA